MSNIIRPGRIYSSSLRNPCPSGTSIGYGDFNGTIFLICNAFGEGDEDADSLALGLGLGLGLGIPILCILCFIVWRRWCPYLCEDIFNGGWPKSNNTTVRPDTLTMPMPDGMRVNEALSEKAMGDLCFDILSDDLKQELMILRVKKGRNLDEFARYAREKKALTVATWIEQMNPGLFPRDLLQNTGEAKESV